MPTFWRLDKDYLKWNYLIEHTALILIVNVHFSRGTMLQHIQELDGLSVAPFTPTHISDNAYPLENSSSVAWIDFEWNQPQKSPLPAWTRWQKENKRLSLDLNSVHRLSGQHHYLFYFFKKKKNSSLFIFIFIWKNKLKGKKNQEEGSTIGTKLWFSQCGVVIVLKRSFKLNRQARPKKKKI